jgi:hypothetical protein
MPENSQWSDRMIKRTIQLDGRHCETGSVQNALSIQGAKAPHTGRAYSEAFLLGVSGGIAFGYFTFEYKGILPQAVFLTRNTFDPLQTMLERLGVVQHVYQTTKAGIAEKNLIEALSSGQPALVWADECSLPYNHRMGAAFWNMMPVVAYAMDGEEVLIADRSSRPFRISMEALTGARARVKDDKYRLVTLDPPQTSKLAAAAQKGIWQCVSLFTDKPPRGSRDNFGFAAYRKLAEMLINTRHKQSWERLFAAGPRLYNALAGTVDAPGIFAPPGLYSWINTLGASEGAERALYADFLDEAAVLLEKKSLREAAKQFRRSHARWIEFAEAILPDGVPPFKEVKSLLFRRRRLFIDQGEGAYDEIGAINARLKKIEKEMAGAFPMGNPEASVFRAGLRDHVLAIAETERSAVDILQESMK